jgi:SAM-dependent methyltransferase
VYYYKAPVRFLWSQDWRPGNVRKGIELCGRETIVPVILKWLPHTGKILEAGCGDGRWVAFLREHQRDVVGIDYCTEGLQRLRSGMSDAAVAAALIEEMPFRNGTFSAVFSHGVVEHFEQGPVPALKETFRVLVDGGLIILVVPFNNLFRRLIINPLHSVRNALKRLRGAQLAFSEYRFSAREVERSLREAGFTPIETHPADLNPPSNIGLYVDAIDLFGYEPVSAGGAGEGSLPFRLIVARDGNWELSRFGQMIAALLRRLSPWLACGMVLFVAKVQSKGESVQ